MNPTRQLQFLYRAATDPTIEDATAILLVGVLLSFVNKDTGLCCPSMTKLCERARRGPSAVRRGLKVLEAKEYIEIKTRLTKGTDASKPRHLSNIYVLDPQRKVVPPPSEIRVTPPSKTDPLTCRKILEPRTEAVASGADAPEEGEEVIEKSLSVKGELYGPVLADLVAAVPGKRPDEIRAKLAKAMHGLGPDKALALGKQAALRDEPWSWLCKAIDNQLDRMATGGWRGNPMEDADAYRMMRMAEVRAKQDYSHEFDYYEGSS